MLIYLDESLSDWIVSRAYTDNGGVDALENLAIASREGNHIVFAQPNLLQKIIDLPEISNRSRAVYQSIRNKRAELGSLLTIVSSHIKVVSEISIEENVNEIQISVLHFSSTYAIQQTILLCENLRDTAFLEKLAGSYKFSHRLRNISIRLEAFGGGGDTTAEIYENFAKRGRMCLAIVDSDKKTPNSSIGSTAKKLVKAKSSNYKLTCISILSEREIENIIPTCHFNQAIDGCSNRINAICFLEELECRNSQIRQHIDMKKGLTLGHVYSCESVPNHKEFWFDNLELLISSANPQKTLNDCCLRLNCCDKEELDKCECKLLVPLGDKILEQVINVYQQMTPQKISEDIPDSLRPVWDRLGKLIITWCCGSIPKRII